MADAVPHPTPQQLAAFGLGKLPPAAAETIARHLKTCPRCQQVVAQTPPDSFLGKVRDARPTPSGTRLQGAVPKRPAAKAAPPPLPAPTDLPAELRNHPKYRIVRELGRGGMGVVYQAVQTIMDRTVALKVINPSVLSHPDALPRFHAEVKAAAKLDHPNIVRAHDADQVGNLHLLVMEYVEGMSLAQVVERQGPLPVAEACRCAHQALLGLQHAFEQGMTHRDVKPQNLMRTPKGQIKVLDFGLARLRGEGAPESRGLTGTGAFMGTAEYVAPEQAEDAHNADIRSDIYSMGGTLYFLLTGQPPFVEKTVVKLVLAHIEKEALPLHEVRADAPAELSAVVARMLAKDPAQRFQTPLEAVRALAPFCEAVQKPAAAPGGEGSPFSILNSDTVLVANRDRPRRPAAGRARPPVLAGVGVALIAVVLAAVVLVLKKTPDSQTTGKAAAAVVMPERPQPLDCTRPGGISAEAVRRAQQAWAQYLGREVEEEIDLGGIKMIFVLVPPGKFRMGSPEGEESRRGDETLHEVTLTKPFDMGKTEVTQAQYKALGLANTSHFQGDDRPVETVSWTETRDWAEKVTNKLKDKHLYGLPTEAEWEYACRGGRFSSQPFGVGDGRALSSHQANFNGNFPYGSADKGPYLQTTCAVGSYPANALGLHDMHGNVWEWCHDCFGPYPGGAATNPTGPEEKEGSLRVNRGGGWNYDAGRCRAADRYGDVPSRRSVHLGFRLARSLPSGAK